MSYADWMRNRRNETEDGSDFERAVQKIYDYKRTMLVEQWQEIHETNEEPTEEQLWDMATEHVRNIPEQPKSWKEMAC